MSEAHLTSTGMGTGRLNGASVAGNSPIFVDLPVEIILLRLIFMFRHRFRIDQIRYIQKNLPLPEETKDMLRVEFTTECLVRGKALHPDVMVLPDH